MSAAATIRRISTTPTTAQDVKKAWKEYQSVEKRGIEFGHVLFNYRGSHKSTGGAGSTGKGLVQLLHELSIPKSTAYYWIHRHEEHIGLRKVVIKERWDNDFFDLPPQAITELKAAYSAFTQSTVHKPVAAPAVITDAVNFPAAAPAVEVEIPHHYTCAPAELHGSQKKGRWIILDNGKPTWFPTKTSQELAQSYCDALNSGELSKVGFETDTAAPTTTTTSAIMDEILRAKKPLAGYLYVWEKTTIESADKSYLWLVENQNTGRAELWRTHELTRIIKTGEVKRRQNCEVAYRHTDSPAFRAYGLLYIAATEEWAQRRLQELKGLRSDVGDFIPPVNPADQQTAAPAVEDDTELAAMFAPPTAEELAAPQFVSEPIEAPTSEAPAMEILPESKESDLARLRRRFAPLGLNVKKSDHGSKYVLDNLTESQLERIATMLVGR